ncbi:MAG: hypothetical protein V3V66_00970, partial [Anaerolineales bacterium]
MRRYTSHLVVSFLLIILSSCNVLNNQGEILVEERETTPVPSATITVTPQPSATLPPTITNTPTVTP